MPDKLRIGIPRTLFYYSYYPLFYKFFTLMGADVIVSKKTSKTTVEQALNVSSNELCIPIKILYGHVLDLKDRVDYIFLPYIISSSEGSYFCPKIIGSPDIIKANIPHLNLLSVDVDVGRFYKSLLSSLLEIAQKLSLNPIRLYSAFKQAIKYQKRFERYINQGLMFEEALGIMELPDAKKRISLLQKSPGYDKTIAVIGHPYVINDEHLSFDIVNKLEARGVRVVTSDKLTLTEIKESLKNVEKIPHWSLGSRVLGAAMFYSSDKRIDGIIYMTPFGCSTDSLLREYMDANIHTHKPLMTLIVDEHSSDAGMITRIEAFLDMIEKHKKRASSNISIHDILNELIEE